MLNKQIGYEIEPQERKQMRKFSSPKSDGGFKLEKRRNG